MAAFNLLVYQVQFEQPVCSVYKHIAIDVGGLGFDYRVGQIGHSVANGSPPLRRFFGAVLLKR